MSAQVEHDTAVRELVGFRATLTELRDERDRVTVKLAQGKATQAEWSDVYRRHNEMSALIDDLIKQVEALRELAMREVEAESKSQSFDAAQQDAANHLALWNHNQNAERIYEEMFRETPQYKRKEEYTKGRGRYAHFSDDIASLMIPSNLISRSYLPDTPAWLCHDDHGLRKWVAENARLLVQPEQVASMMQQLKRDRERGQSASHRTFVQSAPGAF